MGLFNIFKQNEEDKNRSHIKNLLEVAIADGNLDDDEFNLILKIAGSYDISEEEVKNIRSNPGSISFSPPSSYSAKVKLLEDLVKVMIVDKTIDENEVKICKDLAIRLNIAPVIVDELIQEGVK